MRSIKELVAFDEEEITEEIVQARLKDFVGKIDDVGKHYKKAQQLVEKLSRSSRRRSRRSTAVAGGRWAAPR